MAKVNAPMLSLRASGQIAGVLVYSKWKGIEYARGYVVPANPKTAGQVTQRGYLTAAVDEWHTTGSTELTGDDKEAWNRYAGVLGPMSGFNAFCRTWIDERVAGGTPPGHDYGGAVSSAAHGSFGFGITGAGITTANGTLHLGNSRTFFPVTATEAGVAGVWTFSAVDTGFAAGQNVYFYVDSGTPGTDYMRSGLYTALLT
jgi:hypothetical protein